jgi:hypothetical protein
MQSGSSTDASDRGCGGYDHDGHSERVGIVLVDSFYTHAYAYAYTHGRGRYSAGRW